MLSGPDHREGGQWGWGGTEKLEGADTKAPFPQPPLAFTQGRRDEGTTGYARWMGPGEGRLWGDLRREL